jgi:hypothetical protein
MTTEDSVREILTKKVSASKVAAETFDSKTTEEKPLEKELKKTVKRKRKLSASAKAKALKPTEVPRISVRKLYKEGAIIKSETEDEEMIEVEIPHPEVPLASVGFNARMTINLGDYESVQLGVSCVLPCYVDELDDAFMVAKKFVDRRLNQEVGAVRDYRKGKSDE